MFFRVLSNPFLIEFPSPKKCISLFAFFPAVKTRTRLDLMFVRHNGVLSAALLSERKRYLRTIHGNDIRRTKGGEYFNSNMAQAAYSNHYHPLPRPQMGRRFFSHVIRCQTSVSVRSNIFGSQCLW